MNALRRIVGAGALAAIALTIAACNNNPAAPQGNYGTIMGVVKSSSGQPIAGAIVTADIVITSPPTGADGKYTLQQVPIDSPTTTTTVSCTAQGYQNPPDQHLTVAAGKQYEVDFTLSH